MTQAETISASLAPLLLRADVPMKAIEIIGEAISADARVLGYEQGPTKRTTGEEQLQFLETYDDLLRRTEALVAVFSKTREQQSLIDELLEIKQGLVDLY
jgi:hypothetical protein